MGMVSLEETAFSLSCSRLDVGVRRVHPHDVEPFGWLVRMERFGGQWELGHPRRAFTVARAWR